MFERPAITDIVLTRVNFSDRLEHVLDFTNVNEQTAFFDNLPNKLELEDATFQRKDMYIRMDGKFDTIQLYNYGWFHNHIENMRFYFFIENVEYASDNSCLVYIKIDPWQTYQFQLKYTPTFIERKHVTDDVAGNYTFPENLETGPYVSVWKRETLINQEDSYYIVAFTELHFHNTNDPIYGNSIIYNGVISGAYYILFEDLESLGKALKYYQDEGKAAAIVSIMNYPKILYPYTPLIITSDIIEGVKYAYTKMDYTAYKLKDQEFDYPVDFGDPETGTYKPRNKKLLTYPYIKLVADNHNGKSIEYRYEDFKNKHIWFSWYSTINAGSGGAYVPKGYRNYLENVENYDYSLQIAPFPLGSWSNDVYANWLAQNESKNFTNTATNIGSALAGTALIVGGIMTGGVTMALGGAGLVASGMSKQLDQISTISDNSILPNQLNGGGYNNSINYSLERPLPTFYAMNIKPEYAKIIDEFFDKYGYKINRLETPNIRTRKNWNYIKTVDINFNVDLIRPIPQAYEDILKSMFDNGVTIWHNYQTMYNYNSDNSNL